MKNSHLWRRVRIASHLHRSPSSVTDLINLFSLSLIRFFAYTAKNIICPSNPSQLPATRRGSIFRFMTLPETFFDNNLSLLFRIESRFRYREFCSHDFASYSRSRSLEFRGHNRSSRELTRGCSDVFPVRDSYCSYSCEAINMIKTRPKVHRDVYLIHIIIINKKNKEKIFQWRLFSKKFCTLSSSFILWIFFRFFLLENLSPFQSSYKWFVLFDEYIYIYFNLLNNV